MQENINNGFCFGLPSITAKAKFLQFLNLYNGGVLLALEVF